VTGLPSALLVV